MNKAVCCECVEDFYLKAIIQDEGEPLECSVCGETENNAITVEHLGKLMEPIMREHFVPGPTVKKFGDNDDEWWEQEGDPISYLAQEVLGQYFDFEDEIVDAVIAADEYWPGDGGEAYWDGTSRYVPSRIQLGHYFAEWQYTLAELKHGRRFFSPAAQALFTKLFDGIEHLKAWNGGKFLPVVRILPTNTKLFRARVCNSRALLKEMFADPLKHVGPPPMESSRVGRMNADGVVVFYGARDEHTCLAEMRPALGNDVVVIKLKTTRPLRLLDFSRLEQARGGKALSYFQPGYTEQVERRAFLRRLHSLISQPIVPGHESDYLITQTMAEYLAHVHKQPFDGILFASVQRANGTNVVLFPDRELLTDRVADSFHVEYVEGSIRLFGTTAIKYKHSEIDVIVGSDGEPWIHHVAGYEIDDDWP